MFVDWQELCCDNFPVVAFVGERWNREELNRPQQKRCACMRWIRYLWLPYAMRIRTVAVYLPI